MLDKIIIRNSDEAAYCNGIADCRSESDELCPYVNIALATSYVYVVTGGRSIDGGTAFSFDGVYEEKRVPGLHYKKLGEADSYGNYRFLYTDSRHAQTWILGVGKTLSTARAEYRSPANAGRPAVTQWMRKRRKRPSIKVAGVETNTTAEMVAKQLLM